MPAVYPRTESRQYNDAFAQEIDQTESCLNSLEGIHQRFNPFMNLDDDIAVEIGAKLNETFRGALKFHTVDGEVFATIAPDDETIINGFELEEYNISTDLTLSDDPDGVYDQQQLLDDRQHFLNRREDFVKNLRLQDDLNIKIKNIKLEIAQNYSSSSIIEDFGAGPPLDKTEKNARWTAHMERECGFGGHLSQERFASYFQQFENNAEDEYREYAKKHAKSTATLHSVKCKADCSGLNPSEVVQSTKILADPDMTEKLKSEIGPFKKHLKGKTTIAFSKRVRGNVNADLKQNKIVLQVGAQKNDIGNGGFSKQIIKLLRYHEFKNQKPLMQRCYRTIDEKYIHAIQDVIEEIVISLGVYENGASEALYFRRFQFGEASDNEIQERILALMFQYAGFKTRGMAIYRLLRILAITPHLSKRVYNKVVQVVHDNGDEIGVDEINRLLEVGHICSKSTVENFPKVQIEAMKYLVDGEYS